MSERLDSKEVDTKMNRTPRAVTDIPPQTGKLAVVTGANSGIGWHAVLELARAGGEVIVAARSEAKGRDAVEGVRRGHLPRVSIVRRNWISS